MKSYFTNFFRGKRILITGHTGFKGSWLTTWLDMLGAKVFGFALAPETKPSLFETLSLNNIVEQNISDIRDYDSIWTFVKDSRPEIVFHMAAQPLVRRSYREPKLTYDTNIGGTINLLEALRIVGSTKVIIIITTDKVYENNERADGYRETDRLGGHDPYSTSKACTELIAKSYYDAFLKSSGDMFLSTARAGNVIGGGDWSEDRIVPDCIRALTNGQEIPVRSPFSIRPWQHVLDPLYGYLNLAAKMWSGGDNFSGSWNFGPHSQDTCAVKELVEQIISAWGSGSWRDVSSENHLHETQFLKLNAEKASSYLSWRPLYDHIKAINETMVWYHYYYRNGTRMLEFTKSQIEQYLNKYETEAL